MAEAQKKSRRNALLGKAAIAVQQLGLDDADLRAILLERYGVASRTKLDVGQLADLIEHFKTKGFKESAPRQGSKGKGRTQADHPEARKMRALWLSLYHLGVVRDPSEGALVAFAKRVTGGTTKGISAIQWIKDADARAVVEALKDWASREAGVCWEPYTFPHGTMHRPRRRVIEAQVERAKALGVPPDRIAAATADVHGIAETSDRAHDEAIQALGALIREAQGSKATCGGGEA